jgi:hypothetical protein
MTTRTLKIYGSYDIGTDIRVTIDGVPADNILQGTVLYSFDTSSELHGKATTHIEVISGKITLGDVTATYPAVINGVEGLISFIQPIENPLVTYTDKLTTIPKNLTLTAPSTIEFDHLMLNGPSRLIITGAVSIDPGGNIFVGDLRNPPPPNVSVHQDYQYTPKPNQFNQEDLDTLLSLVYPGYK